VKLTLDRASGKNGEKLYLTVKRTAKSTTDSHLILLDAKIGDVTRTFPILVGDEDALSKVMSQPRPLAHRLSSTRHGPYVIPAM